MTRKLNITRKQFESSKYFQRKYGTLKYVSESGKEFKTSKGNVLMFKESKRIVKESLADNEFIVVDNYVVDVYEDDYNEGEGKHCNFWGLSDIGLKNNKFKTVKEALEAVCDANYWDFKPECWGNWYKDTGEEKGRYYTDVTVDNDNDEVSDSQIEAWKNGEETLYCAHVNVWLKKKVFADSDLEDDEMDM